MRIVFFTHYRQFGTVSQPLFSRMIVTGMKARGHEVEVWDCPVVLGTKYSHPMMAKWLGYVDQFILFPRLVRARLRAEKPDTVFVVTDHGLGMWVPLLKGRRVVIHCHDFLAQRVATGGAAGNRVGLFGRWYQRLIRRGFAQGSNFISVSEKTRSELHRLVDASAVRSEVVYNGLNYGFARLSSGESQTLLAGMLEKSVLSGGFVFHIGGNQWYKNRSGVLDIYTSYVAEQPEPLPLVMAGREPTDDLRRLAERVPSPGRVLFISSISTAQVAALYSSATVLLFPSIAEGFGWPIAEAMACGCPVITTGAAPMSEVAGDAALLVPVCPTDEKYRSAWAYEAARLTARLLADPDERNRLSEAGEMNARRFDPEVALDRYEAFYKTAF